MSERNCPHCKLLHASLLEMRNVAAAASRVIVCCGEEAIDRFEAELRFADIPDGFGKRAEDALGPEIEYVEIFP